MDEHDRVKSRAGTWPEERRERRTVPWWGPESASLHAFAEAIRKAALSEVAAGRLLPWIPVAFGFGIVLYFTADHEPSLYAALALSFVTVALAFALRRRMLGFPLALGAAAMCMGFATVTLHTAMIDHPVLAAASANVALTGWVEKREERARSDRIVVRVAHIEGRTLKQNLERVRVSVRRGLAPPVGAFVSFKARLSPPLQPLRPGGYDFSRDIFFQRIGASGFVLGAIATMPAPADAGWKLRYSTAIEGLRDAIDSRIRATLKGDAGSIASALLTGKQDAISQRVYDALFVSSLGHILSVSGYHMAVVAGIMFFFLRALLALIPALAVRYPIKKFAALGALAAATFYLLLSGAEVATQRSYIMIAIVLLGVMVDRPALTMRTLAVAAIAVLAFAPQAVVHPSFQMSFAATLALIASYRNGLSMLKPNADTSLGARIAMWGGREASGLILASIVAGLATTPYAAFHFHRSSPYGLIANLLAMPVVSGLVMPAGIVGLLAMPFGFDAPCWTLMGVGIAWMNAVALWVADLPGAVGRVPAFGTGPLLLGTAGLLLICLLRTRLRHLGTVAALGAVVWVAALRPPDVYVSPDGRAVAVRDPGGELAVSKLSRDSFAVREWLAADADARVPDDKSLDEGKSCDAQGCVLPLPDGTLVAHAQSLESLVDDCKKAALVVTARAGLVDCKALMVDRERLRNGGALALRWSGRDFTVIEARPAAQRRPWTGNPEPVVPAAPNPGAPNTPAQMRDATPGLADLEAGD